MHLHRVSAQVIHCTPGRLRIKIPTARRQVAFFADLQQRLVGAEGISSVTVNPTAASLVIIHDRDVDPLVACRSIPYLSFKMPVRPVVPDYGADATSGRGPDFVSLLAKLLTFFLPKHPILQLAEVLAEPLLRAVIDSMTRSRTLPLPAVAGGPATDPMAIAA